MRNGKVVIEGVKQNNQLYRLFIEPTSERHDKAHATTEKNSLRLWHDRLGHINKRAVQNSMKLVHGMKIDDTEDFFCVRVNLENPIDSRFKRQGHE